MSGWQSTKQRRAASSRRGEEALIWMLIERDKRRLENLRWWALILDALDARKGKP
jgi:hypothetical protein